MTPKDIARWRAGWRKGTRKIEAAVAAGVITREDADLVLRARERAFVAFTGEAI